MVSAVRFDEERALDDLAIRPPKPVTIGDTLLQFHIVDSPGDAMLVLAIVSAVLIGAGIYLLASSVPPQPMLDPVPSHITP